MGLFKWMSGSKNKSSSSNPRAGDGTFLGEAIHKGQILPQAGNEKIGYFDPSIAPFRSLLIGKVAMVHEAKWDQMAATIRDKRDELRASGEAVDDRLIDDSLLPKFTALAIAIQLGLDSMVDVANSFNELIENERARAFITGTTVAPFFTKYSVGNVGWWSNEVAYELTLNSFANLLLTDPEFAPIHTIKAFETKLSALLDERKDEVGIVIHI
jgi:hypothetical protein